SPCAPLAMSRIRPSAPRPLPRRRELDVGKGRGALGRILLIASGAQGEPVVYGSQIAGGAQIGRGRAVELIGALEGAREKDEARSAGGGVVRIGHRRRRLRERNGIGAALERRPRKQLAPLAVELCIEPAGAREQLVDFGPTAPTRGGARRDDQRGGRSRRAVA